MQLKSLDQIEPESNFSLTVSNVFVSQEKRPMDQ